MKKYLVKNKIAEKRIILEEKATNTYENIKFSKKILKKEERILIVSSKTHLYRCSLIAKSLVINADYQGSKPQIFEYIREPFAIVKTYLYDGMKNEK